MGELCSREKNNALVVGKWCFNVYFYTADNQKNLVLALIA
jgi:hypothetical protein